MHGIVEMMMTYCCIDFVFDVLKGFLENFEICSNVSILYFSCILISCPLNCL